MDGGFGFEQQGTWDTALNTAQLQCQRVETHQRAQRWRSMPMVTRDGWRLLSSPVATVSMETSYSTRPALPCHLF